MPKQSENTHSETTPHFDEKRDRIINDPFGIKIGIRVDRTNSNPYNVKRLKNQIEEE